MKIRGTTEIDQELDEIKSSCEESERLKEQTGQNTILFHVVMHTHTRIKESTL